MVKRYIDTLICLICISKISGMRSRDIFGRLRLRLRLRGSIPAPAPAPSKTVRRLRLRLRLRAKCTGSGGSGSDDQVLIWALTSNTIFKMPNVKIWLLTDLAVSLNATLKECLWNLSLVVIQGHWLTLERLQTPSGCAVWDKWLGS